MMVLATVPATMQAPQVVWGWFPGDASLQIAIKTLGARRYDLADFCLPSERSGDEGAGARPGTNHCAVDGFSRCQPAAAC